MRCHHWQSAGGKTRWRRVRPRGHRERAACGECWPRGVRRVCAGSVCRVKATQLVRFRNKRSSSSNIRLREPFSHQRRVGRPVAGWEWASMRPHRHACSAGCGGAEARRLHAPRRGSALQKTSGQVFTRPCRVSRRTQHSVVIPSMHARGRDPRRGHGPSASSIPVCYACHGPRRRSK